METKIQNVVDQMRKYHELITKADKDNSLTTVQKIEYASSVKQNLENKGIKYDFRGGDSYDDPGYIIFYFPSVFINDVGIIKDVLETGAYPIQLEIGTNIAVYFEPRNIENPDSWSKHELTNSEYSHLKKGNSYNFSGIIYSGVYHIGFGPEGLFVFGIKDIKGKKIKKDIHWEYASVGDCFIATTCYNNHNAPEVLVLRQFRDEKLLKTFFGRVFVRIYYAVSPFFAKLISKSDLLKKSVREYFLERIVTRLQRQNKLK